MAGKRKIEGKVTRKEHGPRKRKLDLRKEKKKVKLWLGALAGLGAVQVELMEKMDTNSNLGELPLICYQLRGVNSQRALLDGTIRNYIDAKLARFLDDDDEGKGNA